MRAPYGPRLASSNESMVLNGRERSINHSHFSCRIAAANNRVSEDLASVARKEMMALIYE